MCECGKNACCREKPIRYFRNKLTKLIYTTPKQYNESYFINNTHYEEVLVTEKPKPKEYKVKVALFENSNEVPSAYTQDELNKYGNANKVRLTNWTEVTLVEETDSQ